MSGLPAGGAVRALLLLGPARGTGAMQSALVRRENRRCEPKRAHNMAVASRTRQVGRSSGCEFHHSDLLGPVQKNEAQTGGSLKFARIETSGFLHRLEFASYTSR